jgi:hypothetical protein
LRIYFSNPVECISREKIDHGAVEKCAGWKREIGDNVPVLPVLDIGPIPFRRADQDAAIEDWTPVTRPLSVTAKVTAQFRALERT